LNFLKLGAKYRGEFEERIKAVLKEVKDAQGGIILFIDEIHLVLGAGTHIFPSPQSHVSLLLLLLFPLIFEKMNVFVCISF
jgi:SpoVK/Ycf46/Vps4 family AAA+-type ATPase